jgi:lipopolysaccharide biosynthesis glycosyltransferase
MPKKSNISIAFIANPAYTELERSFVSVCRQLNNRAKLIILDCAEPLNEKTATKEHLSERKKYSKLLRKYAKKANAKLVPCIESNPVLRGISLVVSEYVIFVDNADLLTSGIIERMLTVQSETDADIIFSKTCTYFPDIMVEGNYSTFQNDEYIIPDGAEPVSSFVEMSSKCWLWYHLNNKLIRTSLLNELLPELTEKLEGITQLSYAGNLMICSLLFSKAKLIAQTGRYIVHRWQNYDKNVLASFNNFPASETEKFIQAVTAVGAFLEASGRFDTLYEEFAETIAKRFWWRVSWALNDCVKKQVAAQICDAFALETLEGYSESFAIEIKLTEEDIFGVNETAASDKNIHIYISMHKPSYIPQNNKYIYPIQVGAEIADERIDGIIHDDTGDNISAKNRRYCEMTAQYWAWKNDPDADYYGFWHYRRYFSYNENENEWGVVACDALDEKSLKKYYIDEEHISAACSDYDILVSTPWTCREDGVLMTVYEHWCKHFERKDIDLTVLIVAKDYPQYYDSLMSVLFSHEAIFCNMFIMRKDLFNEYCEFVFRICEKVEALSDHSKYNTEEYRAIGHIAERLLSVYVTYIETNCPEINVAYTSRTLFTDTRPLAAVKKIDKEKCISIALACNDYYMRYTSVLLQSILDNSNIENYYDIVIMHRDISEHNQKVAKNIFKGQVNFSLRFADVTRNFENYTNAHIDRHLTLETYYRFLLVDLFAEYDRVLYLDCDMVVNDDIEPLFFSDIDGKYCGAVRDFDFIASAVVREEFYEENCLRYLKLDDFSDYFQAGMLLLNLAEIRKSFSTTSLMKTALSRKWYFHDQDVINYSFKGNVTYLDPRYNVFSLLEKGSNRSRLLTIGIYAEYAEQYRKSARNPAIIHYAGIPKVWKDIDVDLSNIFWDYARRSPYYESLLQGLLIGDGVRSGWMIFDCDYPGDGRWVTPFFVIKCLQDQWTATVCLIDFTYLADHGKTIDVDTLVISSSSYPHDTRGKWRDVKQFMWLGNKEKFKNDIFYRLDNEDNIIIYVRYRAKYEGFSFSVRQLESRSPEKPYIEIIEQHNVVKAEEV